VTEVVTPEKTRHMYRYAGTGVARRFGVHNNSLHNVHRGLVERVFRVDRAGTLVPPPYPRSPGWIKDRLSKFASLLKPTPLRPLTDEEFLNRYQGRKRLVYEAAAASLQVSRLTERDSYLSTFVKAEKLDLSAKPDPAPRVIQPRAPRFNVALGKFISHQEKRLFKWIDKIFGRPTVMKGRNCLETGAIFKAQWDLFNDPVAVGMDASRFDQHVSDLALKWEHSQWLKFIPKAHRKALKRLLAMQITNRGVARTQGGSIRYTCVGRRMSGDMNTSSGNIMLMCAMIYAFLVEQGLTTKSFWVANNGDDSVVVVERKNLHIMDALPGWFLDMGFTMKVEEPVHFLEAIEFCQTHPCFTDRGWTMVRDPVRAMAKDLTANCDITHETHRATWLHAVREGGLALTDGVPVWPRFYECFVGRASSKRNNVNDHMDNTGFMRLSAGLSYKNVPISDEARCSFYFAFGITPDEQLALEAEFARHRFHFSHKPEGRWNYAAEQQLPGGL